MKIQSTIPGIKAVHAIITPNCRAIHEPVGALEEAFNRLRHMYSQLQVADNDKANFHVVMTVERSEPSPKKGAEKSQAEREEGWGALSNDRSGNSHYFRDGQSLCGKWMAWGPPRWESNQKRGPEPKPRSGTCKACWKKAPEEAPSA